MTTALQPHPRGIPKHAGIIQCPRCDINEVCLAGTAMPEKPNELRIRCVCSAGHEFQILYRFSGGETFSWTDPPHW